MHRHSRQEAFFGAEGQRLLRGQHVLLVGCGGLGNHVLPQLAGLGVGYITAVDDEELSETNRNRYILARATDPVPGTLKVTIAERAVREIDVAVTVHPVHAPLRSRQVFDAAERATAVFGCVDNDGARLVLMELACAYGKPLFDLATDIPQGDVLRFGGRAAVVDSSPGCLVCAGLIDLEQARRDLENEAARRDRAAIYGIPEEDLGTSGPSVVSLNGVVASLGVTEFVMRTTGLRPPAGVLSYRGQTGIVSRANHQERDCYYCKHVKGAGYLAGLDRYLP